MRSFSLRRFSEPVLGNPPSVGSRVAGKYRVLAALESGRSGSAHVAVDIRSSSARRLVVLETLRGDQRQSTGIDAFVAEARLRQKMDHPNVVQTLELVQHEGLPVLVTEYVEGESLATLLALAFGMPEFSLEVRLTILAWALRGLHHVHQLCDAAGQPLLPVHSGISPHDVIITFDGTVKLAGFGSATGGRRSSAAIAPPNLEYLAPEQLQGPSLQASDVFAAGVMLWELVALQRFWSNLPEYEIQRRLLSFDIPDVARLKPNFGGQLGRICRKALAADPSQRYPSATELLMDLERYLVERSAVAAPAAIALVMNAACGSLREEARRALDEASVAFQAGRRRGLVPSAASVWRGLVRAPRASSTTALWAAGTLGALLIAVAAQRTRITPSATRDERPAAGESVLLQGSGVEARELESGEAAHVPPGDGALAESIADSVADHGILLAPSSGGPTTTIQTLRPDARGARARNGASRSGGRNELDRRRSEADARARRLRRLAEAERGAAVDDTARASDDQRSLTIRMER